MKPILSVALIALVAIVAILSWYGLFAKVTRTSRTFSSMRFVFQKHRGNYREIGPIMDAVYEHLKAQGMPTTLGAGIYFDNPREVSVEDLRSLGGCILPQGAPSPTLTPGTFIATLPEVESTLFAFPYKGKLSAILGMLKVYPKISAWFEAHPQLEGPILEIYDVPEKRILYIPARAFGEGVVEKLWAMNAHENAKG